MAMMGRKKRRAPRRQLLGDGTCGKKAGGTIPRERGLRDRQLFLLPPFRWSNLRRGYLFTLGFLTSRLPALNNWRRRSLRSFGTAIGPSPFVHSFRLLALPVI